MWKKFLAPFFILSIALTLGTIIGLNSEVLTQM